MVQDDAQNNLVRYRKRMRFTQLQVLGVLGWKNKKGLCLIESGNVIPTLTTAFKLAIVYRVPVEFLFQNLYEDLRNQVRAREASLMALGQQSLPLAFQSNARYS
jgi:transcriptional regulator with XRE-family HTH domain